MKQIARRWHFGLIGAICGIVFLIAAIGLPAQQNDLSSAASQMAAAVNKSKQKTVAVFDFVGPNSVLTPLGRKLADEFNDALSKSHKKFKVEDRSAVVKSLPRGALAPATAANKGLQVGAALDMGWKTAVVGSFTVEHETIVLSAEAANAENGDRIALVQAQISLTDALKQLIPNLQPSMDVQSKPPMGGQAGYSMPRCIRCPQATYSKAAADDKTQGVVVLSTIVTLDGRAIDIAVVKDLPGLTTSAIRAVSGWEFQPATDSNGNPTPVRALVEVTFRLY